jgi:regulatory protein
MKNKLDTQELEECAVAEIHQDSKTIKKACLRLLTRRDHSRKQIQDKLALKGYDRSQVAGAIEELSGKNLQNDSRYAESYARVRSQKGFGPIRIAFELRQQGIDSSTVEQVLRDTTDDWQLLLEQVYLKKYSHKTDCGHIERGKQSRFLLQRGFSNAMINTLFNQQSKKST